MVSSLKSVTSIIKSLSKLPNIQTIIKSHKQELRNYCFYLRKSSKERYDSLNISKQGVKEEADLEWVVKKGGTKAISGT